METATIATMALVVLLAYGLGAVAGYGGNILAVPVLIPLLRDRELAISVLLLVGLFQSLHMGARNYADVDPRALRRMVSMAAIGAPVGLLGGAWLPERPAMVLLGAIVLASGLVPILRGLAPREPRFTWRERSLLVLGGAIQGAFAAGGGPIVAAAREMLPTKEAFRGTMFPFWTVMNTAVALGMLATGRMTLHSVEVFLWAIPSGLLAGVLGQRLAARLDPARFRLLVAGLLVVSGALTLVRNLA